MMETWRCKTCGREYESDPRRETVTELFSRCCQHITARPSEMYLEHLIGKDVVFARVFTGGDAFEAIDAAEEWLRSRGYSIASMASGHPTGVKRGDYVIAKWYNLDEGDRRSLDGVIVAGDIDGGELPSFRHGPVTVILATDEQLEEVSHGADGLAVSSNE